MRLFLSFRKHLYIHSPYLSHIRCCTSSALVERALDYMMNSRTVCSLMKGPLHRALYCSLCISFGCQFCTSQTLPNLLTSPMYAYVVVVAYVVHVFAQSPLPESSSNHHQLLLPPPNQSQRRQPNMCIFSSLSSLQNKPSTQNISLHTFESFASQSTPPSQFITPPPNTDSFYSSPIHRPSPPRPLIEINTGRFNSNRVQLRFTAVEDFGRTEEILNEGQVELNKLYIADDVGNEIYCRTLFCLSHV